PRGINLHYLQNNGSRNSRVVYSFKTEHASSPDCPDGKSYPIYKEISTPQKKYYQWSNDNGTYSQLGGIIETDAAFLVLFTGEPDTQGKALNSSRVGEHTDPRNIGFVKLSKDFYSYEKKLNEVVLTEGSKEVGGFYTFGGYWSKQENYGIKWLSNYKDKNKQSASHLKTCLLANGNVLLLWKLAPYDEYFSKIPPRSQMMVIDENGKVVLPPTDLGESIKLNRRDELMLVKNKVICVDGSNEKIILHTLTLK
ncbi:MAG: hypothetical protein SFU27_11070, partial [Thermonemataceae bacterium]|nr:hypothetical protein [Thermonemataceae bacterium]